MKKTFILLCFITAICFLISFESPNENSIQLPGNMLSDSLETDRAKYIKLVMESIKGKEKMTVDSVFGNLKVLGGFPAENLLLAMNSWSRALGVSCNHCHDTNDFMLDTSPKKNIARQMSLMTTRINKEFLANIKGLNTEKHIINCTSCHNGKLKPALRISD
jgi:hypothetical protein